MMFPFFPKCSVLQLDMNSTYPPSKTSNYHSTQMKTEKENGLVNKHVEYFLNFFILVEVSWRVALQLHHSEPWEQESILCQTMTRRKLCVCV